MNDPRAMLAAGRAADARDALLRLAARRSLDHEGLALLALACARAGDASQAAWRAERAASACPPRPEACMSAAQTLLSAQQPGPALALLERAAGLAPGWPEAHVGLSAALLTLSRNTDAAEACARGLGACPGEPRLLANASVGLLEVGRARAAAALLREATRAHPDHLGLASGLAHTLTYTAAEPPESVFGAFRAYGALLERLAPSPVPAYAQGFDPERRLRVGIVSPDLRRHPVSFFLAPVLEALDPARVEVVAYATSGAEDEATARVRAACAGWVASSGVTFAELAGRIRADRIDVALDLSGHSSGHALPALHLRPAPVIATWLGFPSTTGVAGVTHRLTDAAADPLGPASDAMHTESLLRMPTTLALELPADLPAVREPPSLRGEPFTFGSLNSVSKLDDPCVEAWAGILLRVPGSRLLLKHTALSDARDREATASRFVARGVERGRLLLEGPSPYGAFREAYHRVDLALDPFPFNGATTTCDTLSMGVPVVALRGDRSAGRVAASLLTAVGLPELVAETQAAYADLAVALANDGARLRGLRLSMRDRLRGSRLCDVAGFASNFEAALREAWRGACERRG